MKKSILFLINGYGVEQNDSIDVYSKEVMPNLDNIITSNYLVRLPNNFLDYKSAYRNFSMGIDMDLTHSLIERNISKDEVPNNQLLKYITNETVKKDSNLHIFAYIDCYTAFEELAFYIRDIKLKVKNKIFVHFILCQKSILDYKDIEKGITLFTYEMGTNIKVGIVTGETNMNNLLSVKDIVKSYITEMGEKWKDFVKKINVFIQSKETPNAARTFAANYGYRLEENDQILFFNYSNISIDLFRNELFAQKYRKFDMSTLGFYSLFPVRCSVQIPFMYNYALASNCFLNSLKAINARCLVMDKKDNCSIINYYLTGLRNSVDECLRYAPTDDGVLEEPERLVSTLKNYDKELIIINSKIDDAKTVEDLKGKLNKIDASIGAVYDYCVQNGYTFFVSSLYGMMRDMYNAKAELCKVNLYSKVPLIISNCDLSLGDYNVEEGNMFDLSNTILFTINNEFPNTGIFKKKSKLFSFLYKKPKSSSVEEKKVYTNVSENNGGNDVNQ